MRNRKILLGVFLVILTVSLVGCAAVNVEAPPNASPITLAPKGAPCRLVTTQLNWYALWGLVPITNNTTTKALAGVTKTRVKTEISPVNFLINIIGGIVTISTNTAKVYSCH